MRLILSFLFAISLFGQCPTSPAFPASVATDANLAVAANNLSTTMKGNMAAGDAVAIVTSTVGWSANMMATVDSEIMFVTGVSGSNLLLVSRACEGTAAAAHLKGKTIDSRQTAFVGSTAVKNELKAIQAWLLQVPVAFSALPACVSGIEGRLRAVTDSNTATWGDVVAGSGSNHVLAYCNSVSWTVAAK